MNEDIMKSRIDASLLEWLNKIPLISCYARTRGWFYIVSWCHRITGILMVFALWVYLYCFHALRVSENHILLAFFVWGLAIPAVFHALNGARLILYEVFGQRNDETMIRWVFVLTIIYGMVLGTLVLMGNQGVSPFLYWVIMVVQALVMAYGVTSRIFNSRHSFFWKMQRISGCFLMIMLPAYLLFIQLRHPPEFEANVLIRIIQNFFLSVVYLLLLLCALYHAGYGIWSVVSDYLSSRNIRSWSAALVAFITLILAWIGVLVILRV